ncbi:DUF58 domain-containing protein [Rubritalea tangerina]|uniref:DUF58 domain-containing protein n=1 Tax=Rubritalea tangerina TaxID=430798 RepID=UPI00361D3C9B
MELVQAVQARVCAEACLSRLGLPLNARVWRGQAGEFAGAGVGSSIDFQDHRSYVPGDDPRHINWQAYARTGQYTMKLYREEVRPVVDLMLDVTESMFFDDEKARRVAEVFLFIGLSAMSSGASLSIHLVSGNEVRGIEMESLSNGQWYTIARELSEASQGAVPMVERVALRSNAIRVWVSDCLFEGDPAPIFRQLSARHGSLILLCPHSRRESTPEWSGNYEFVDVEKGTRHSHTMDVQAVMAYKSAYAKHFDVWQEAARRYQSCFARVPSDGALFEALSQEAVGRGGLVLK